MALAQTSGRTSRHSKVLSLFRGLSLLTALSVFALVVLGGVVRVTGSGLGCPDWPLCHGGLLPPLETKAIIEYAHRLVASVLVGPLILATCLIAWIAFRRERWLSVPAALALILLVGQALLGGVTVVNELPGSVVLAHLALGEALLGVMVLMLVVVNWGPPTIPVLDNFPWLVLASVGALFLLLLSGSYVTTAGATTACLDWPLCQGDLIPDHTMQMIHMAHRLIAAVIGIFLLYTLFVGIRNGSRPFETKLLAVVVAILFVAQVMVGAATVWLKFPVDLRALHLAMATAAWAFLVALGALSFTGRHPETRGPANA